MYISYCIHIYFPRSHKTNPDIEILFLWAILRQLEHYLGMMMNACPQNSAREIWRYDNNK
jgi:hypothetical protein